MDGVMEIKWWHYALLSVAIVAGLVLGYLCVMGERTGVIP